MVANCKHRETGVEYAVKMVDKVETPFDLIKKEADIMQGFDHENIVKFHGVFFERCFVCIVMDRYTGGDLVAGLQLHLTERGQINCQDIVHVAQQMGASIRYLHNRNIVHRDIKGDNYLMDRKDMTDPNCHIVLTDFGTTIELSPGQRLSDAVGTKVFWAPEFFRKSYELKVDVWAMGIVMYGLISGRFPFRDEKDVMSKEVRIPKRVHPFCQDYIRRMLDKVESTRPSADEVMQHSWVAIKPNTGGNSESEGEEADAPGIERDSANEAVKERRQELIKRLDLEHFGQTNAGRRRVKRHTGLVRVKEFIHNDMEVPGAKIRYEWWESARLAQSGLLDMKDQQKMAGTEVVSDSNLELFAQMLKEYKIDPSLFGKSNTRTLEELASEVRSGAARLMLDATEHKKIVRVVDVVVLRIHVYVPGRDAPWLLMQTGHILADGRSREALRLPGTKKEPHESTRQATRRIVHDYLDLNGDIVSCNLSEVNRHEEETDSPSYPGVRTVYRFEVLDCTIVTAAQAQLQRAGLPDCGPWKVKDPMGESRFFMWMTAEQAGYATVKLNLGDDQTSRISTLVRAPLGLNEEALQAYLTGLGIDVQQFGRGDTRSLKELSCELIRGESTLMQDATGALKRVVDIVVMILTNSMTGDILMEAERILPDGHSTPLNRFPACKRRPDENQFISARRILRKHLEIDENLVRLNQEVQFVEDETTSAAYPCLKTVYRKRIIRAEITDSKSAA